MDPDVAMLLLIIALVLGLAALFAQFRLFSIDASLKRIVQHLDQQTSAATPPQQAAEQPQTDQPEKLSFIQRLGGRT